MTVIKRFGNAIKSVMDIIVTGLKGTKTALVAAISRIVGMACPKTGSLCGYKKAKYVDPSSLEIHYAIVILLIPEDAKRSSAFGNKCRCSKAKVLDIYDLETGKHLTRAFSEFDVTFKYKIGQMVHSGLFDENRWHTCAPGIHFFMTEKEAREYPMV